MFLNNPIAVFMTWKFHLYQTHGDNQDSIAKKKKSFDTRNANS